MPDILTGGSYIDILEERQLIRIEQRKVREDSYSRATGLHVERKSSKGRPDIVDIVLQTEAIRRVAGWILRTCTSQEQARQQSFISTDDGNHALVVEKSLLVPSAVNLGIPTCKESTIRRLAELDGLQTPQERDIVARFSYQENDELLCHFRPLLCNIDYPQARELAAWMITDRANG